MGNFLPRPFDGCKTRIYNMGDFLQLPFDGCKTRIYNMGGFLQLPFGGCTPVFFTTTNWWLQKTVQQPLGCCKHPSKYHVVKLSHFTTTICSL